MPKEPRNTKTTNNMEEIFFPSSKDLINITDADYTGMPHIIEKIEAIGRVSYEKFYIVDLFRSTLVYVSDDFSHLCGLTRNEVQGLGFRFYNDCIPEDDKKMLNDMIAQASSFCNMLIKDGKENFTIYCDFHLSDGIQQQLINHQVTPLAIKDGQPWLALCTVSISPNHTPGNLIVKEDRSRILHKYDKSNKEWKCTRIPRLNPLEHSVLRLTAQGMKMEDIACRLNKSLDTIRSCKRNLFRKLCVKNMSEAIAFVQTYKLM